jgi:ABC-type transporter Mla subunit MlaD
VTSDDRDRQSTADTMHDTADALERSEAILHDSAERIPDEETTRRLDNLGDKVTRQAKDIDKRADSIDPSTAAPG